MNTTTVSERAPRDPAAPPRRSGADRILGHPVAYLLTAAILLALFGGTFVANPERVAPTKDPAYYTWRTEALVSEDPETVLNQRGAFDMFAGGYRVAAPIIGGFLRTIAGMSALRMTVFLMVVVPVLTALLLAGFAYRQRKDPLIFHTVAFGAGSLYLTPPFVGYLDNILCLMFLAAAIWFIAPARVSWASRAALFLFTLLAGYTHPTTLAIFCVVLGAMAFLRLLLSRFDLRSVLRRDGPALATAFLSAVAVFLTWQLGMWGVEASLDEAALPPPYGADFFVDRLQLWVDAMRPALNGPLLVAGVAGLIARGRRWADDDLARISLLWLLPLVGIFGFVAGKAYPYYRFFNTTLAWVLLVGLGAYFLIRFFLDRIGRGTLYVVGAVGVTIAVALIFATNFAVGFDVQKWNDPAKGWLSDETRADLDALRAALVGRSDEDAPVIFVIDDEDTSFQIWGHTKLSGNTSRYALPRGQVDRAYLYLGSLENFMADEPTLRGEETYDDLSPALLEDARAGMVSSDEEPIIVVAGAFNESGANAEIATGQMDPPPGDEEVWVVDDATVSPSGVSEAPSENDAGTGHLALVLGALVLLLIPGWLALRAVLPQAELPEALGMVPALSVALLSVAGIVVVAIFRAPFSTGWAWLSLGLATLVGAWGWFTSVRSTTGTGGPPART